MSTILTGGCLCGRTRFRLRTDSLEAAYCHCTMCRRATGCAAWLFLTLPASGLDWLTAPPSSFASSRIASRSFCPGCGSPMTFRLNGAATVDVSVGCLDTPGLVQPARHHGIESRPAGLAFHDGLPVQRSEDSAGLLEAWRQAYGPEAEPGPPWRPDRVNGA